MGQFYLQVLGRESHSFAEKIIFTKSAFVSFSAVEVVCLRVIGIVRISRDCSGVLQFKYSDLVSESKISTTNNINDSESSATEDSNAQTFYPLKYPLPGPRM